MRHLSELVVMWSCCELSNLLARVVSRRLQGLALEKAVTASKTKQAKGRDRSA